MLNNHLPPRVEILGVKVSAVNLKQAVDQIENWILRKKQNYVCVTPAHGVMECQQDPSLLKIFNGSGMTTPDGMAIVWLLRLKGFRNVSRVYGPDLLDAVCDFSNREGNFRHFFYGGAPGIADRLAAKLVEKYPNLIIAGTFCPPFRPLSPIEDQEIVSQINAARPDIIWVGISTPKQERWMDEHMNKVDAPVLVGVGAAFDFLSGNKKQAPRWMQRAGLEWLFRLATEPKRLWKRYAQYPRFVYLVFSEMWHARNKKIIK